MKLYRWIKPAVIASLAIALFGPARIATAADPYEINVILSMTGAGTFIGQEQWQAMQIAETAINKAGGINGRPIKFVMKDDQSNPQNDIQFTQALIAAKAQVVIGPTLTASCNAIMPLVAQNGPVMYCLTAGARPEPRGFVFSTLTSTPDLITVAMRYFRQLGFKKMAYLVTTDASGQDAEQGILTAAALPENKTIELVAREHFAPADISISAQLSKIKGADPEVVLTWASGTAGGTVLRGLHDAGINLPTLLSPANMTGPFTKQFGPSMSNTMFLPGMAYYGGTAGVDAKTRAAMNLMTASYRGTAATLDQVAISAWDPTMFVVDTLRKVGLDAPATKIRDAMVAAKGWVGVNGPYDFQAYTQRGIGQDAIVMVRWDAAKNDFVPSSRLGGAPLGSR
jgi:branched-chain amino acid transport system substrate-binding protein